MVVGSVALLAGCATAPTTQVALPAQAIRKLDGSYHRVRRGDTLWRISRSFGLDVETLARVNRLPDAGRLEVGQQLFIPLPPESPRFLWPGRGRYREAGALGIDIALPPGSLVRASRSGRVAVATRQLAGWGQTIVVDHTDGYVTLYAGLEELWAKPGAMVRQGRPIGRSGQGPLHFEIRQGTYAKNPLTLLP